MAKKKIVVNKTKKIVTEKEKAGKIVVPLYDRVLIRSLTDRELEKKTNFGIILPETVDEEKIRDQGVVMAVGKGKYDDGQLNPMTVKVGDRVMFSKYGFDEITVDGEDYFILKEENILAIIK